MEPRPLRTASGERSRSEHRYPGIYDYGAIGNLSTAALVSRFGSVDWACFPWFSSPSLFGRLLDWERGGYQQIHPVEPATSRQSYLPSTNILETRFTLSRGRSLSVVDFMPILQESSGEVLPMVVRLMESLGGPVEVTVTAAPRFDYGRHDPSWRVAGVDGIARYNHSQLACRFPGPAREFGAVAAWAGTVYPDEAQAFQMIFGPHRSVDASPEELFRHTERFWRNWVHGPAAPIHRLAGGWHSAIERSELVLKLLSHVDTGVFVAAATTSLPERIGGERNWDYRYVWLRDAAFCAQAMLFLGHLSEARGFLGWVLDRQRETTDGRQLRVVYGAYGETDLRERILRHLSGYRDSRPVRVGNQAAVQFQLDVNGELFDAAELLARLDAPFVQGRWAELGRLADFVVDNWERPDRGIWETRGPPAHYVHSKLMAWVALDRALRLARKFGVGESSVSPRWVATRDRIREALLTQGFDRNRDCFVQSFGSRELDAANLRIPLVDFLPFEDPRVVGTIAAIEESLGDGAFVRRYRNSDGIDGGEGAFLPCSFWLVECLARSGRRGQAMRNWNELLRAASPHGLFSEEYDRLRREALGNYPQAFTHIAVLRAALALGLAAAAPVVRSELRWFVGRSSSGYASDPRRDLGSR